MVIPPCQGIPKGSSTAAGVGTDISKYKSQERLLPAATPATKIP